MSGDKSNHKTYQKIILGVLIGALLYLTALNIFQVNFSSENLANHIENAPSSISIPNSNFIRGDQTETNHAVPQDQDPHLLYVSHEFIKHDKQLYKLLYYELIYDPDTRYFPLKPNGWLDSETVDLYIKILNNRMLHLPDNQDPKFFYIFPAFMTQAIISEYYTVVDSKMWNEFKSEIPKDFLEYKYLSFPVNIDNKHWVLAMVNLLTKNFYYFNSLQLYKSSIKPNSQAKNIMKRINDFLTFETAARHNELLQKNKNSKQSENTQNSKNTVYIEDTNNDLGVIQPNELKYRGRDIRNLISFADSIFKDPTNVINFYQTDNHSCGVYIIMLMTLLASSRLHISNFNELVNIGRVLTYAVIKSGQIDLNSVGNTIRNAVAILRKIKRD